MKNAIQLRFQLFHQILLFVKIIKFSGNFVQEIGRTCQTVIFTDDSVIKLFEYVSRSVENAFKDPQMKHCMLMCVGNKYMLGYLGIVTFALYIYIYIYIYTFSHVAWWKKVYTHTHTHIYIYIYIFSHVAWWKNVYIYIYISEISDDSKKPLLSYIFCTNMKRLIKTSTSNCRLNTHTIYIYISK